MLGVLGFPGFFRILEIFKWHRFHFEINDTLLAIRELSSVFVTYVNGTQERSSDGAWMGEPLFRAAMCKPV